MLTADYGGTGGKPIESGLVVEEPDIEIGAGVSSKGKSTRRTAFDAPDSSSCSHQPSHGHRPRGSARSTIYARPSSKRDAPCFTISSTGAERSRRQHRCASGRPGLWFPVSGHARLSARVCHAGDSCRSATTAWGQLKLWDGFDIRKQTPM